MLASRCASTAVAVPHFGEGGSKGGSAFRGGKNPKKIAENGWFLPFFPIRRGRASDGVVANTPSCIPDTPTALRAIGD